MPKIINDLKITILNTAKEELLTNGYSTLTIRKIAQNCHIAVGTMYNYFPSKEVLAAEIMLMDWIDSVTIMQERCSQASEISDGLFAIFEELNKFRQLYRDCWDQYAAKSNGSMEVRKRHKMLSSQITEIVSPMLSRLKVTPDEYLAEFTAEMLLTLSGDDSFHFEQLHGIIKRLYS